MRKAKKATKLNHEEPTILHPARWPIGGKKLQNSKQIQSVRNIQLPKAEYCSSMLPLQYPSYVYLGRTNFECMNQILQG